MTTFLTLTPVCSWAQDLKNGLSVAKWKSSGKTFKGMKKKKRDKNNLDYFGV